MPLSGASQKALQRVTSPYLNTSFGEISAKIRYKKLLLIRPSISINRRDVARTVVRVRCIRPIVEIRKVRQNSSVVGVGVRSEPNLVTDSASGVGLSVGEGVGDHPLSSSSCGSDSGLLVCAAGCVCLTLNGRGARGSGFACDKERARHHDISGERSWFIGVWVDKEELVGACKSVETFARGGEVVGFGD